MSAVQVQLRVAAAHQPPPTPLRGSPTIEDDTYRRPRRRLNFGFSSTYNGGVDSSQQTIAIGNVFRVQEPPQASVAVKTAISLLNLNQPADAAASLAEATKANPKDTDAIALLGYSLYLSDPYRNSARATKQLRRAIDQDDRAILPRILLGRVLEFDRAHAAALACYQDCLAIEPGHPEAKQAVGRLHKLA